MEVKALHSVHPRGLCPPQGLLWEPRLWHEGLAALPESLLQRGRAESSARPAPPEWPVASEMSK